MSQPEPYYVAYYEQLDGYGLTDEQKDEIIYMYEEGMIDSEEAYEIAEVMSS
ncbi:hypothetical protein [Haloarchaeobius baliensis]|uniref:hypothetical protein n=1 Tax=Haloarchaeobius baliensis TaxID=1670458 RepID=UPI003F884D28